MKCSDVKYLSFKAYHGGLNNNRMSLELAAGLAFLTRRALVYYGATPIANSSPDPTRRFSPGAPTILDLFDVPVERLESADLPRPAPTSRSAVLPLRDLLDSVIYHPGQDPFDAVDFLLFKNGRGTILSLDEELDAFDVLQVEADTLGYYSYVFYLPGPLRSAFLSSMQQVKPKPEFEQFSAELAARLGHYNAIHVRRGDFTTWPGAPRTGEVSGSDILATIRERIPRDETLAVCTDESWNEEFFAPIFAEYRGAVFLDRLILEDPSLRRRFDELPFVGDIVMGLVCQLTTVPAAIFVGTMASTYTGVIQRMRGHRTGREPFLFLYNQFDSAVPFQDCKLLPTREGPYSWNRCPLPMPPQSLGWFREWPESFTV